MIKIYGTLFILTALISIICFVATIITLIFIGFGAKL